jgi:hypothetical protein
VNGRGRVGCFAYKSCFALARKEVQVATKSETEAEAAAKGGLLGGLGIPENHEYLTRTHSGSAVSGFSLPLDSREATRKRMQGPGGLPFPFSVCSSVMADLARTRSVLSPWTRTFRLYDSSIFTPRHIPLDFYGPMRCCYDSTILGRSFARLRSCARQRAK